MITLTEVRRTLRIERTLIPSHPRETIERTKIVINPSNIVLLEPHSPIGGSEITRVVINTGSSTVSKLVEGNITSIKKKMTSNKGLLNG